MTTTSPLFSCNRDVVKSSLCEILSSRLDLLFDAAEANSGSRVLELRVWDVLLVVGRAVLGVLFAMQARRATEKDLEARRINPSQVRMRMEKERWYSVTTTFGLVCFPLFAYREQIGRRTVTRTPAVEQFKLHRSCRSSELCLEWETRLGCEHPFRTAQRELEFFTHGAVTLEDTTIAKHTAVVGSMVGWTWTYRTVRDIREILRTRATRDENTGRPIVYASSDAHALRRFVDPSCTAQWKMANGFRLWCSDRFTGDIVHLGGEYTWGDCVEVEAIARRLIDSGHLPVDGDYGEGVVAELAWITDGAPWIEDRILKLFPNSRTILDAFHALEYTGKLAALIWGKGHPKTNRFNDLAYEAMFGAPRLRKEKSKTRRGHRKRPRAETTAQRRRKEMRRERKKTTKAQFLIDLLEKLDVTESCKVLLESTLRYITNNAHRMDYALYIQEGYQIGSGAMESLHRVASQIRLKRSGSGWLPETAQAIFNLRMMTLVERTDEFWSQPDLADQLVIAFQEEPLQIAA